MTAEMIYERALSYLYEYSGKDKDFKAFFLGFLSTLLVEALPYENSIREMAGGEILPAAPVIGQLFDTVPYDERITAGALPYGIAAFYFEDEGDSYRAAEYRNRYIEALESCKVAVVRPMRDEY